MYRLAIALALGMAACSGDPPPNVDANPLGPMCSKQTYDLCVAEHDCDSGNCMSFPAQSITVCTVACGTGCPVDKNGMPGVCDGGVCRPSAPNMCHL